jgi:hypothetical protein
MGQLVTSLGDWKALRKQALSNPELMKHFGQTEAGGLIASQRAKTYQPIHDQRMEMLGAGIRANSKLSKALNSAPKRMFDASKDYKFLTQFFTKGRGKDAYFEEDAAFAFVSSLNKHRQFFESNFQFNSQWEGDAGISTRVQLYNAFRESWKQNRDGETSSHLDLYVNYLSKYGIAQ